jgi:hypothetical protein
MKLKLLSGLLLAAVLLTGTIGCASSGHAQLILVTGGTAGTYYPIGQAMAQIIGEKVKNTEITAVTSDGSVANAESIGSLKADLALIENTIAYYAEQGQQMFSSAAVNNIRGIAALYPEIIQIVTLKEYGITHISDLRGKSVGVGAPGSGTAVHMAAILKAAGLDETTVDMQYLDFAECADALKNGTIHAGCIVAGIPTAAVTDIAAAKDISIVSIPAAIYDTLKNSYPFYVPVSIPSGTYTGVNAAVTTIAVQAMLVVRSDLSEDLVYRITKALFENIATLAAAHPRGQDITLQTALDGMPIPLHSGARKYYEEMGISVP